MTFNGPEILASYRERIPCLINRTIELHHDKIRVHGRVGANRVDATVLIANLTVPADRIWIRSKHLHWSALVVSILVLALCFTAQVWPKTPMTVLSVFFAFVPAVYYFLRSRKEIEYVQFKGSGGSVLFDVGKTGPDSQSFDDFVSAIEAQIADVSNGGPESSTESDSK